MSESRTRGISSSTLKMIAMAAMLMDHIGVVILEPLLMSAGGFTSERYELYMILRVYIGRAAFPVFCFLMTEGFLHTSNVRRYAQRLLLFACLSEIPFDLALRGRIVDMTYQNVLFTLFFGLMAMTAWKKAFSLPVRDWMRGGLGILGTCVCMGLAELLSTDYGAYGVLCMTVIFCLCRSRSAQVLGGSAVFVLGDMLMNRSTYELTAPLGFIPVWFYNGQRGLKLKYIFYAFYPLHLLILYGFRIWFLKV